MAVTIQLLNIGYGVILGEIYLVQFFKENKDNYVVMGGNLRGFFFSLIDDYRE